MRKIGAVLSVLSVFSLTGCVTNMSLTPEVGEAQQLTYNQGRPVVSSKKTNTVFLILPATAFSSQSRPTFTVAVENDSPESFLFSEEAVSAKATRNKDGQDVIEPLATYSYDYVVNEAKRKARSAMIAAAIAGAADSYSAASAGYSYQSGTINTSSTTYGPGYGNTYSTTGYGTYSGTTYNAGAAYQARKAAQANTERNMDRITRGLNVTLSSLAATYLKKQTVLPGQTYGGIVEIQSPKMPPYDQVLDITVNVQGEDHNFKVTMNKVE